MSKNSRNCETIANYSRSLENNCEKLYQGKMYVKSEQKRIQENETVNFGLDLYMVGKMAVSLLKTLLTFWEPLN